MSDSVLEKYVTRPERTAVRAPERGGVRSALVDEADETEDCGCFGYLRGVKERGIMLELRKRDGCVVAVGYAWIECVEFSPDTGIVLHVPGRKIRITGVGLNAEVRPTVRLFEGISRHRVPWISESSSLVAAPGHTILIEQIDVE